MQFTYSTPVKESQTTPKPSKTHNQTREGDWVCLNCNNLNFSFRKKCNRCKTQTRKQNEDLQNAYTLYFYNQQENNMYNYENSNPYQSPNDQPYYTTEFKPEQEQVTAFNEVPEHPLKFSRNSPNQFIEITLTSPFKEILNTDEIFDIKYNQKLRTPSSKKKRTQKKKNDMLPSISPLLKKLLAKEDTNGKCNNSNTKDPLNVALFYDEMWDGNKQNLSCLSNLRIVNKGDVCLTNSGKKGMQNSRMQKTNDSLNNGGEDDGFEYFLKSPERDYEKDQVIEIDEGDEELAQIISRIII